MSEDNTMRDAATKPDPRLLMSSSDGITVWRVPHDHQPGIFLGYWYRLNDPERVGGPSAVSPFDNEFDVREVPGYTPHSRTEGDKGGIAVWMAYYEAEQKHHAAIIAAALDAGWLPVAIA